MVAIGVNCCAPDDVVSALRTAATVSDLPLVAYPNSGETWRADSRGWTGTSAFDVALVPHWVAAGVRYVGGCCRVGPADIAALAAALSTEG